MPVSLRTDVQVRHAGVAYPFLHGHPGSAILVDGQDPERDAVARCLPVLAAELSRYPEGFFRRIGLNRLTLARNLRIDDQPVLGIAMHYYSNRPDWGVAVGDEAGSEIIIDAQRLAELTSPITLQHALHHEVYHVIDFMARQRSVGAAAWPQEMDPDGRCSVGSAPCEAKAPPGFASFYAQSSEAEDRAETFAYIMCRSDRPASPADADAMLLHKADIVVATVRALDPRFAAR